MLLVSANLQVDTSILQSMASQGVGHNLATEQQQQCLESYKTQ